MSWDAQWTSGWTNFLPGRPLDDLRLALKERCDAVGVSMPTGWTSALTSKLPLAAYFAAFQQKVTDIIPYYIDHTTAWEGTADEPTMWNTTTISAHTTAGTRLAAPAAGYLIPDAWLQQQRELLNLMRWVRIYKFDTSQPPKWGAPTFAYPGKYVSAGAADWATAKANFKAASWSEGGGYGNKRILLYVQRNDFEYGYLISAQSFSLDIAEDVAGSLQYSVEAYWKESSAYTIFTGLGPQDTQGAWNLLQTLPEGTGSRVFDLIPEATFETAIDSFVGPGDFESEGSYSHSNDCIIVGKFDGPNGFAYKDW